MSARATAPEMSFSADESRIRASARPPAARISSAVTSTSGARSSATTAAPAAANSRALARPMPLAAPVIRAVLPRRVCMCWSMNSREEPRRAEVLHIDPKDYNGASSSLRNLSKHRGVPYVRHAEHDFAPRVHRAVHCRRRCLGGRCRDGRCGNDRGGRCLRCGCGGGHRYGRAGDDCRGRLRRRAHSSAKRCVARGHSVRGRVRAASHHARHGQAVGCGRLHRARAESVLPNDQAPGPVARHRLQQSRGPRKNGRVARTA